MGWPVAHSRSPLIHGHWIAQYGLRGAYVPLPVAPEHFAQALRMLSRLGFRGVNVTVPHKEAALKAVDIADHRAREIGAAYREVIGSYDVAMTAVEVGALIEERALVEIEATAVVPE